MDSSLFRFAEVCQSVSQDCGELPLPLHGRETWCAAHVWVSVHNSALRKGLGSFGRPLHYKTCPTADIFRGCRASEVLCTGSFLAWSAPCTNVPMCVHLKSEVKAVTL